MKPLTVGEIAKALNGKIICGDSGRAVTGVSTDSRKITENDLFFALQGEKSDGHAYLEKAREKGCRAAVVSREILLDSDMSLILVEDTLEALQRLAKYYLSGFESLLKIGVTGSTGKTSTKELLYWSLCGKYVAAKNTGNFNNHIGMPLTALSVNEEHTAAIFEMGMGNFGEVELLADIARPDMGIITNIGVSHISELGSRENILKAKLEITNYFDENSKLIINFDNDLLSALDWSEKRYKVVKVGSSDECDYIIKNIKDMSEEGVILTLQIEEKDYDFIIPIPGVHNGHNGALAIAAASEAGIEPSLIADNIKLCKHTDKRLVISNSSLGVKVIDDTYNASPDSMRAGIDVLLSVEGKRKLAILGDMLGMGEETEKYHRQVGEYAGKKNLDMVITVGKDASYIADSASEYLGKAKIEIYESREALLENIDSLILPGDAVLIKASRAIGMELIAEYLLKDRS